MKIFNLLLLLCLCSLTAFAKLYEKKYDESISPEQIPSQLNDTKMRYEDWIYRETIKTVMLNLKGTEGTWPIIELNSQDQLHLQFDDLDPTQRQLYYKLEHCNADWTPSGVMPTRAIRGLQQDFVQDFAYSMNTRQQYLHYDLIFPNENMKILLSGNYILRIFEDGDPDNLVLTRRFLVYNKTAKVAASIRRPSPPEIRDTHQEIDVSIDITNINTVNIPATTKMVIRQNQRWDNTITLNPFSINQKMINYNYDDGTNCFEGNNEFRWADIRSLRMNGITVKKLIRDSALVEVVMLNDDIRTFSNYQTLEDLNGSYYIRNTEGSEPQTDGDYCWVNFNLPFEAPLKNGDFYIYGGLSDWQYKEEFKLFYDYPNKSYRARILLKQGLFNYCYSFLPQKSSKGDFTFVENSYFNTENEYLVLFYNRTFANDFDELNGLLRFNSIRNQ
jgi:hypothetical protein